MTRGGRGLNRSKRWKVPHPPSSPPTFSLPTSPPHPPISASQPLPSSSPHLLLFKDDLNCKYFFFSLTLGYKHSLQGRTGRRAAPDALHRASQTIRACGPDPAWVGGEGILQAATGSVLGMVPGPQSSKGPPKMFKARKTIYLASK